MLLINQVLCPSTDQYLIGQLKVSQIDTSQTIVVFYVKLRLNGLDFRQCYLYLNGFLSSFLLCDYNVTGVLCES